MAVTGFDVARTAMREKPNLVAKKIILDVDRKVVLRTPVDSGRARANWLPSWGAPLTDVVATQNPDGSLTINGAIKTHSNAPNFQPLYLVNNLPYIEKLEFGHSQQSPAGMVRLSVAEVLAPFK